MIITEYVSIKISGRTKKYYKNKGYDAIIGEDIIVSVNDLPTSSKTIVRVKCDVCGSEKSLMYQKYNKNIAKYNLYTCSIKCSTVKIKKTNLEKYGTVYPQQSLCVKDKTKKTNNKKYGVDNVFQLKEVKEKITVTNLEKYGTKYPQQNKTILNKSNITNLSRYGVERPSQSKAIHNKMVNTLQQTYSVSSPLKSDIIMSKLKTTNLKKYGVDNPTKNLDIIKKMKQNSYDKNLIYYKDNYNLDIINHDNFESFTIICDKCNGSYNITKSLLFNRIHNNSTICTICNPYKSLISDKETKLLDFINDNYSGEVLSNIRDIITPYELDIYLPELKLAFEFNGLYWHCELYKDNNYHNKKTNMCIENNIQLVHIWEDDWDNKQTIIKSMILNKLKQTSNRIFGRKCQIKSVKSKESMVFLTNNHIQGKLGAAIKLGLYYNDELVSLMTFGKKRKIMNSKSNDGDFELLRFCNKLNTSVIGGASKLFKHFLKTTNVTNITTYADRSHSNGGLYNILGFEYGGITRPNYYYVVDNIRKYRYGFRKDILVKEGYDIDKSEHEIMLERKIYRIYNSGNYRYNYVLPEL